MATFKGPVSLILIVNNDLSALDTNQRELEKRRL
jgi:hypothetical protein